MWRRLHLLLWPRLKTFNTLTYSQQWTFFVLLLHWPLEVQNKRGVLFEHHFVRAGCMFTKPLCIWHYHKFSGKKSVFSYPTLINKAPGKILSQHLTPQTAVLKSLPPTVQRHASLVNWCRTGDLSRVHLTPKVNCWIDFLHHHWQSFVNTMLFTLSVLNFELKTE